MNWRMLLLLLFPIMLYADGTQVPASAFVIDTIEAVVVGQGGRQVITRSDVTRPSLAGTPQTLEDLIFERLVYLDAQKFKILADEEAVDKYLAMIQKENNLTLDQLKEIFAAAGYTYEEGREQFKRMQTVNSMIDFKIRSHVIVPRHLVEQYYAEHPVIEPARYCIQIGILPFVEGKQALQKKALVAMAKTGKEVRGIRWNEPFWIMKDDVAAEKDFIFRLKVGQSSLPHETAEGFEVYRLVNKQEEQAVSLEVRYKEIADILRRPLYQELMEKYKKQLFDTSSVLYLG